MRFSQSLADYSSQHGKPFLLNGNFIIAVVLLAGSILGILQNQEAIIVKLSTHLFAAAEACISEKTPSNLTLS